ncbi:endo-1,3(4)-beta-glucanase [Aspergillus indologenus CBS 114.80]|uniref:endo-1,3(4)-beta-glucanase n=1 Tax=Aspergillus indologenus CBS 114.80 TaxID=1450541 RepID=A0A2V5JAT3_9EURO|nr:endo-1,3(4)-beta-glucanase [Aspergillus indologenus CBS 114.80]
MTGNHYSLSGDDLSRYPGATTTQLPKIDFDEPLHHAGPPPPPGAGEGPRRSNNAPVLEHRWYDPRGWSTRKRLLVAAGIAIVIIIAVAVGAVEGTKKSSSYPDYSRLNYELVDTYAGASFFDRFEYYSGVDPTDGFVQYVNKPTAQSLNLTYVTPDASSAVLRVDTADRNASHGRRSVRLESTTSYDTGLFVFDIRHSPYGCGLWPALWLTDPVNWPANGEIDVVETNNLATEGNAVTLHTDAGCNMKNVKRHQTGTANFVTCDNSTHSNAGCGVQGPPSTYGQELNENGGGIYALELRDAGIRTWFFPRAAIPADITSSISRTSTNTSATPDPSTWATPLADFPNTHCDIAAHFRNQSIIANIDLCGELGAQKQFYTDFYHCPGRCVDFVRSHPDNFTQAYWEFAGFWVFRAT